MTVRTTRCRSCGAELVWMVTATGKRMPVDADRVGTPMFDAALGHVSHFATCPAAAAHRRPRSTGRRSARSIPSDAPPPPANESMTQVRMVGNSVCPQVAEQLVRANVGEHVRGSAAA